MAHNVVDGVVHMTDAINSKEFSRTGVKNAVRALRKGRLAGKVGRPATVVGEKEQRIENVKNDNDDEDAPFTEVSMSAAYSLEKRHPELWMGTPLNLDVYRFSVSCRSLVVNVDESSTHVPADSKQLVVHTADTKAGLTKERPRMINFSFVAAVAADGYAFPSVILCPSAKLPEELKSLISPTLEIWANGSSWMDNEYFKRDALTVLPPSIIERR
ncbi:uncharacterized protein MONOS_15283 [Monocercomonoides exilis]|uniref:uncharacterized protein n=1 Tax=Monocercomonoides exilis TaxID=2049356 RepID=UPI003559BD03|nr:hypothetical protein MONOS_15283 [Monocercomonoides exilis]|eukprot:MONOS_15283.1-p1 / transcript=MONOS_15283.1 / gene=MONOS_15283 / organism=Monocercomonoides_exilis_PA203 / gene_product=unspecified product / transcript_product=unspecified product / location=Mono_scaffold01189:4595-5419(-) / protein_length=215 / sequence_SO=supercontig / SO=protein_coding / is_pseudo=false